jgi:anaerobic dimethyl sulfoxide reductase subunit C (anchor subunit)
MEIQWPLVIFSLLAGGGAGALAFAGLGGLFKAGRKSRFITGIIAIILLVIGGVASIFHLGNPANVMSAITNIFSFSGISVELLLLGISVVVALVFVIVVNREGLETVTMVVGIIGVIIGVVFAYALGSSYLIEAQVAWNSITLALSYMTSGLALGGFIFLAVAASQKEEQSLMKGIGITVVIVAVAQVIAFIAYGAFVGFDKADVLLFWAGAVVVGSLIPVVAGGLVAFRGNSAVWAYVSLVAVFVGGIALRVLMWSVMSGFLNFFDIAMQNRGKFMF